MEEHQPRDIHVSRPSPLHPLTYSSPSACKAVAGPFYRWETGTWRGWRTALGPYHRSLRARSKPRAPGTGDVSPHQEASPPAQCGSPLQETTESCSESPGPPSPGSRHGFRSLFDIPNRIPDDQPGGDLGSLPWASPPSPAEWGLQTQGAELGEGMGPPGLCSRQIVRAVDTLARRQGHTEEGGRVGP